EQAGKLSEQTEALIALAQAYQALGHYNKALQSLQSALPLVEKTDDRLKLARIKGVAGNLYLASGQAAEAAKHLNEGLQLARELGTSGLTAAILNDLGNLLASEKKYEEALKAYTESMSLARKSKNQPL